MSTGKNPVVLNKKPKELKDLVLLRTEIHKINSSELRLPKRIKIEEPPATVEITEDTHENDQHGIKEFIRQQIKTSEKKILTRLDRIESKLNQLLGMKADENESGSENDEKTEDVAYEEEEHIIEEFITEEVDEQHDEYSSLIFPIADEETFDWFMLKLQDLEYKNNLVSRRWHLTRNVGTRSFNVSVKDFLRMHFELAVCIKYSVSGFGSRGTKKKKVDSKTLSTYVYDCFNKSYPNVYSIEQVSKAITQFWGRSQDTFSKMHDRALKKDFIRVPQ